MITIFSKKSGAYQVRRSEFYSINYTRKLSFLSTARELLVKKIYRNLVPRNSRVLQLGCGCGKLLGALSPEYGVGVDFCPEAIKEARENYPELKFFVADAHNFSLDESDFDFIILSGLINDLWDVQTVLEMVRTVSSSKTRIVFDSIAIYGPYLFE